MERDIVQELREHADSIHSIKYPDLYRDAAGVIEVLRAPHPPNVECIAWIDINEELPDDDICVLVACGVEGGTELDVFEAFKDSSKKGWSTPDGCMAQNVRYWAEMPAGPKAQ